MHVLPQVRELERRFGRELVVIGVHAGKFPAERVTRNIAHAVERLEVTHPVINDRQYRVWRSFGVSAWPTLVLLDAQGLVVGRLAGEFLADDLAPTLERLIHEAEALGLLHRSVSRTAPPPVHTKELRYPGKVLALPDGRVFLADTGNRRILQLRVDVESLRAGVSHGAVARLERTIGSGSAGREDGALDEASFEKPQGMALAVRDGGEVLYVADSGNHVVRLIDLSAGFVETLAGGGSLARSLNRAGSGRETSFSSPWDLALQDDRLLVAMAGMHQLWSVDLARGWVEPWAGSGREGITDGPAFHATLAQPTGLALCGARLYFTDSESSAVRYAEPAAGPPHSPQVTTAIGRGLFEFGDADGQGGHVRLQHPYGLAAHGGLLYVADTYNNKIKRLDPQSGRVETLFGGGENGLADGEGSEALFDEPQGLAAADGVLYVADTNNHELRAADLMAPRPRVLTLRILDTRDTVAARLGIRCGI